MEYLVLGIDAAWTPTQPSGVALVGAWPRQKKPSLRRLARSYKEFISLAQTRPDSWLVPPTDGDLSMDAVLKAAQAHAGRYPDIVVADIPLARDRITGRRPADRAVSRLYGAKWAGTHTPTVDRPGAVSSGMFGHLSDSGYLWMNGDAQPGVAQRVRCFPETYPHPVIIEMLGLHRRLPYKVAKRQKYWPDLSPDERFQRIALELDRLRVALTACMTGISDSIPSAAGLLEARPISKVTVLKGLEDALDAVVCAYVGCELLADRATPFGDQNSAIWIPCR